VVIGEDPGSKAERARALSKPVLDEAEFLARPAEAEGDSQEPRGSTAARLRAFSEPPESTRLQAFCKVPQRDRHTYVRRVSLNLRA
jgi:hypothetical protein